MSLIDDIKRDREAGTQTAWTFQTVKTSCGVCHRIGPFKYNNGTETHACVYEDYPWTTPARMSEPEANARRIARVPAMEAALIAAEELVAALDIVADGQSKDYTDNYLLARDALAAYRKATS